MDHIDLFPFDRFLLKRLRSPSVRESDDFVYRCFHQKIANCSYVNLILFGIYDGESLANEIKESGFPVILSSMYNRNQKWEHGYDKVYRLPAVLYKAGVPFAFSTQWAATSFDLPIQAARAVAYGLPAEEALKALTLNPARIMGLEDYGCIRENNIADLVITDGDLLETSTSVKAVFVKGRLVKGKSFFEREYLRAKDKVSGEF